jgi:hypothetical protein
VLRRGLKPPGFRSRGDDGVSPPGPPGPEKICTPIYERDPTRSWPDVSMKPQGPKLVRDRLLDHMSDHEYHSAHELEALLPNGEWVRAMRELLAIRFAFDRVSNSFRIRRRLINEKRQVLVALLAGIDATQPETSATLPAGAEVPLEEPPSREEIPFDPTQDEGGEGQAGEEEQLHLSASRNELSLSASDSSTMTAAILAKKGSGKTYLGMVLAEEFMMSPGLGVPVVIVDPTGVWYGLRSMADGSPSSFAVLTLGGEHGDLAITCRHGEQVANLVDELRPKPVIIDVSRMAPPEQHEFMADFGQKLFMLSVRSPLHLIIDEADEFAPQSLQTSRHQRRSLEVIDRIVRRGRTKGLGVTLISQRPAVVNKNVLSQIDSLFLLNMVAPGDLNAVDDWLKLRVKAEQRIECLSQLANLPPGVAFCTQSGILAKFRKFTVRRRETFDSGRTPKPNEVMVAPVLAKVLVDSIEVAARCLSAVKIAEPEFPAGESG